MGQGRKKTRKLKIAEAKKLLVEEEAAKLVNDEEIKLAALKNVEQNGIVFLDEIDKIATRSEMQGADVSRQGVQRDLLPLVEGTTVSTKHGMVERGVPSLWAALAARVPRERICSWRSTCSRIFASSWSRWRRLAASLERK